MTFCWFKLLCLRLKSIQCRWFFKKSSFVHVVCSCLFSLALHCLSNFFLQKVWKRFISKKLLQYIPQEWIVHFMHSDWFNQSWLEKHYSPVSSHRETKWLLVSLQWPKRKLLSPSYSAFVVYNKTVFQLSVSESGGHLWLCNSPPPFTSTSVKYYCYIS